jgi:starch phosphorylase
LERAVASLATRLPPSLAVLARLAFNYRWSWLAGGPNLFSSVDPHRWQLCGQNPVRLLQETSVRKLEHLAADATFLERAARIEDAVLADTARPPATGPVTPALPLAYFCAEFGVHTSLPLYSGGLGILAGDFLKAASDAALPCVAIGLLYRHGYFRQRLDRSGLQHEYWVETDPERVPAALVTGDDGNPLTIRVPILDRSVVAQIWRIDVGRVPLFLLDTERSDNHRFDRWITGQLYVADRTTRFCQYVLLGVGGVRALKALGIEPGIIHLNEGHAALAPLASAHADMEAGCEADAALEAARRRTVFTTHTPVPAGNETYSHEEIESAVGPLHEAFGLPRERLLAMGRTYAAEVAEPFGMTQVGLRMSRVANAVSRRHRSVARAMWQDVLPRSADGEVRLDYVTNGVHVGTWMAEPMHELLTRHLGARWEERVRDGALWAAVDRIPDEEVWEVRNCLRARLVEFVRDRSVADRLMRNEPRSYVEAAAREFAPNVLTIGFARRLATYKRAHLLVSDPARSIALVGGPTPLQVLIAGKAHPSDDAAKDVLRTLFAIKQAGRVGERVAVLHDYDMAMAAQLVHGCDVWINAPRPPLDACGTSGMKSAMNGGLQLSVLDGWWAEGYQGTNGWAVSGEVDADTAAQDARHAAALYEILEREVVPEFYDRDARGVPRRWVARIKASLRSLVPAFSAARMLADYVDEIYVPKRSS